MSASKPKTPTASGISRLLAAAGFEKAAQELSIPDIPGLEHAESARQSLRDAGQIRASHDETNPAAGLAIAEAQAHASLAIWEALADIAAELHIIRRQREDYR